MSNAYCKLCENKASTEPHLSYFRFPKDINRCISWIQSCGLDIEDVEGCYTRYRLCSKHFEDKMFSSMQKNRLKKTAIPTLNLQQSSNEDIKTSRAVYIIGL